MWKPSSKNIKYDYLFIFSVSNAKKAWSKLSHVFRSLVLLRREEVKNIDRAVREI